MSQVYKYLILSDEFTDHYFSNSKEEVMNLAEDYKVWVYDFKMDYWLVSSNDLNGKCVVTPVGYIPNELLLKKILLT